MEKRNALSNIGISAFLEVHWNKKAFAFLRCKIENEFPLKIMHSSTHQEEIGHP